MNDTKAQDILITHINMLNHGSDTTDELAEKYPQLAELLFLAKGLHGTYEELPVSAEFVSALQTQLEESHTVTTPEIVEETELVPDTVDRRRMIGATVGTVATGVAAVLISRYLNNRTQQQAPAL